MLAGFTLLSKTVSIVDHAWNDSPIRPKIYEAYRQNVPGS